MALCKSVYWFIVIIIIIIIKHVCMFLLLGFIKFKISEMTKIVSGST